MVRYYLLLFGEESKIQNEENVARLLVRADPASGAQTRPICSCSPHSTAETSEQEAVVCMYRIAWESQFWRDIQIRRVLLPRAIAKAASTTSHVFPLHN